MLAMTQSQSISQEDDLNINHLAEHDADEEGQDDQGRDLQHLEDVEEAGVVEEDGEVRYAGDEDEVEVEEEEEEVTVVREAVQEEDPHSAEDVPNNDHQNSTLKRIETALRHPINVVHYPSPQAAKPVHPSIDTPSYEGYQTRLSAENQEAGMNPYAPFKSKVDWEVAQWAKLRGVGSTAASDLLGLESVSRFVAEPCLWSDIVITAQLQEKLGLSYKNSRELNKIVDSLPASRPRFKREEITVAGETYEIYFRDVLDCLRALFSDPEFAPHLVFLPERHYADPDHTVRLFHDMHTGRWWWGVQVRLSSVGRVP